MNLSLNGFQPEKLLHTVLALLICLAACGKEQNSPKTQGASQVVKAEKQGGLDPKEKDAEAKPRRVAMDLIDNRYLAHLGRD